MTVDLSKISKAVQKFVADVAKQEGSKKEIDTKKEYDQLSNYLAGNTGSMNVHEKEFIQGFMIEYENKTAKQAREDEQKRIEESTTENTKDAVKDIKKWMSDKRKIDSDVEAQALASMLKNTAGDLNSADIEYIKNVLIESGYESYVPKEEDAKPDGTAPKQEEKPAVQQAKTETPETSKEKKAENNASTTNDTSQAAEKPAEQAPTTEQKKEPSTAPTTPKRRKSSPARPSHNQPEPPSTPANSPKEILERVGEAAKEIIKPANPPKAKAPQRNRITELGRTRGGKTSRGGKS